MPASTVALAAFAIAFPCSWSGASDAPTAPTGPAAFLSPASEVLNHRLEAAEIPPRDSAAIAAAEEWLPFIDAGEYAEAWERASEFARTNFPLDAWVQAMASARGRLGSLLSRRVVEVVEESPPPGAPSGEYVTILYESRFSAWEPATERVTLMWEEAAGWKVLGYLASGAG